MKDRSNEIIDWAEMIFAVVRCAKNWIYWSELMSEIERIGENGHAHIIESLSTLTDPGNLGTPSRNPPKENAQGRHPREGRTRSLGLAARVES